MNLDADLLIVGGGLVGQSLCCALEGSSLRAIQIEAQAPRPSGEPHWDERNFALAQRSVQVLAQWEIWPHAAGESHPIEHVHVSSRGDFGVVRIHASDLGVAALGYCVPARAVAAALAVRLAQCRSVQRLASTRLLDLRDDGDSVIAQVECDGQRRSLRVLLVVGADGTESALRELCGITSERHDYVQTALATTVQVSAAPSGWAFERFTDSGPIALLPRGGGRMGLVWTVPTAQAESNLALDDAAFLAAAQNRFGSRVGCFERVGARQAWPLALTRAHTVIANRTVLIGNAAQTIHPIGAQGFNLGLRDVLALVDTLQSASCETTDPGAAALLQSYQAARAEDRAATIDFSDALARGFAHTALPIRAIRSAALAALDRLPLARRHLGWSMMGWRAGAIG